MPLVKLNSETGIFEKACPSCGGIEQSLSREILEDLAVCPCCGKDYPLFESREEVLRFQREAEKEGRLLGRAAVQAIEKSKRKK